MTYMMVFVLKIPSINQTNKSSTDKVFTGCKLITFRTRFSSRFFLLCALTIGTLLDFPSQIFPSFYSTLSLCKIYEFLSYNNNPKKSETMIKIIMSWCTCARVRLRALGTVRDLSQKYTPIHSHVHQNTFFSIRCLM